ncbi:hypothetical protein [Bowmanella denitrificans]|uniref:hypothetical protein n=1 Tax=Bowmanella denitrificans TaxID=366582 RepID=UPI000C9AC1B1|nr:hypothetical protein [Bowmanella denitrificans]
MKYVIALLALILVTLLFGPVVGVVSTVLLLLCLIPGFGTLVAIVGMVLLVHYQVGWDKVLGFACLMAAIIAAWVLLDQLLPSPQKPKGEPIRRPIPDSDLYEDQFGDKWQYTSDQRWVLASTHENSATQQLTFSLTDDVEKMLNKND